MPGRVRMQNFTGKYRMSQKTVKVAVTGAAGQIGYAALFALASGQAFGPNTKIKLHLLELEQSLPRLQGVVMELEDCAFPLLEGVECFSDPEEAFSGVNWALLIGAKPRGPGMERSDLLQANRAIFQEQGAALDKFAAEDVRVLVVGNPCNTNAHITMKYAPSIPKERFFAMTMLDQNRARSQLAIKAGVPVSSVTQVAIWGNHSATQFPDYFHAKIEGKPAIDVLDESWLRKTFIPNVQKRGAAVISARQSSSAASAANGIIETLAYIEGVHPEAASCFSVAIVSSGEYDIEPGLLFSYPCKRKADGSIVVVEGWEHSKEARQYLDKTQAELVAELSCLVD